MDRNNKKNQDQNSSLGRTVAHNSRKTYSYKISTLFLTSLPGILPFGSKVILAQVSNLIRDFLWQGGKGNQKKFHLVNWETVKHPINEGGLQIRDFGHANIALGGKIIWKLYSNSGHPVSQILRRKYLQGNSMRNIQAKNTTKGTMI